MYKLRVKDRSPALRERIHPACPVQPTNLVWFFSLMTGVNLEPMEPYQWKMAPGTESSPRGSL